MALDFNVFFKKTLWQISKYSIFTVVTYFIKCEQCWWRIYSRIPSSDHNNGLLYKIYKYQGQRVRIDNDEETVYMQRQFLILGENGFKVKLES